ncbi:MAG: hypothetical protein ACQESH_08700 [Campylobacterota bacterium]
MKTKEIYETFGIAPSTLSDWSKEADKKYNLAKLLKNMSREEAQGILQKKQTPKPKPLMLLSTVNCSIGNKKKHFTLTGLKKLFYKDKVTDIYEKYALKTIKAEALDFEINDFIQYYKISPKRVEKVLSSL